jgi:hypothetical protein
VQKADGAAAGSTHNRSCVAKSRTPSRVIAVLVLGGGYILLYSGLLRDRARAAVWAHGKVCEVQAERPHGQLQRGRVERTF